jgi:hypothetical protein
VEPSAYLSIIGSMDKVVKVPSIPARHQSYGFEEDEDGKLIPQVSINHIVQ